MLQTPSQVAEVRTLVERPYLPALHCPVPVEAMAPADPKEPQARRPLQVAVDRPVIAP